MPTPSIYSIEEVPASEPPPFRVFPAHVTEDCDEHGPYARCQHCDREDRCPIGIIVGRAIEERWRFADAHRACGVVIR